MYNVMVDTTSCNALSWEIPFSQRLNHLRNSIRSGQKTAMMIYQEPEASTFRYRCYNVFQALQTSTRWTGIYFYFNELADVKKYIADLDLLILVRCRWTIELDEFIKRAKFVNVPVAFDVDDLIYDLDYLPMVTSTLNAKISVDSDYEWWFALIARIGNVAKMADAFISTNQFLGERLTTKFGKECFMLKNTINIEQMQISKECVNYKSSTQQKQPFVIGYFSGSPTHANDFKTVEAEIIALLEKYGDINLSVVGYMEFTDATQKYVEQKRITFTPLVNYLELQRLISQVDVNIVPLVLNTFTNSKSELKFFEASIVETITCAAPSYTYAKAIKQGETGFICQQGEWFHTIESIYKRSVNVEKIANNAKQYCYDNYLTSNLMTEIEDCYDNCVANYHANKTV